MEVPTKDTLYKCVLCDEEKSVTHQFNIDHVIPCANKHIMWKIENYNKYKDNKS